ncbi:UNVERIFIED_CONTAM: protein EARLY FLOWERING 4 [Sesamum latifolium]|uniref:Protein EARLY FLOWERING 4 n=1 Tax=Sesamum latifolium TaxID=2727402 RepID=A0AAW2XMI4_9LAMI
MDDNSQILITANATADHSFNDEMDGEDAAEEDDEEESCDVESWEILSKSFKEVQSVLDHNRRLIQQVNDNHRSKIPYYLLEMIWYCR